MFIVFVSRKEFVLFLFWLVVANFSDLTHSSLLKNVFGVGDGDPLNGAMIDLAIALRRQLNDKTAAKLALTLGQTADLGMLVAT